MVYMILIKNKNKNKDRMVTHTDQSEGGTVAPDNGVRPPRPHTHRVLRRAAPPARRGSGGAAPSTRPVRKAKRRIRRRWSRAMKGKRCPFLRNMTDKRILALDEDLDRRRNAFLAAQATRDAQVQVASPTHDVVHRPPAEGRALDAILAEAAYTCPSDVITPHAPAESLSEGSSLGRGSRHPIALLERAARLTRFSLRPHALLMRTHPTHLVPASLKAYAPLMDSRRTVLLRTRSMDSRTCSPPPRRVTWIIAFLEVNMRLTHPPRTTTWIIILLLKAKMRLTHPPRSTWIISLTRAFQPAILICLSVEARRLHLPWLPPKWRRRCMYPLPPPNSFHLPTTLWEGQQRAVDACLR